VVTLSEWWAVVQTDPDEASRAWGTLTPADRNEVRRAVERARILSPGPARELGAALAEAARLGDLDALVESWSTNESSEHMRLEVAAVHRLGRPLDPGEPVPGCACEACAELTAPDKDRPAQRVLRRLQERRVEERAKRRGRGFENREERRREWERQVERARDVPVTWVAVELGLGELGGHGRERRVRCPFHDDEHPSLRVNDEKRAWFCDPCGEGGDGLDLFMRVRGVSFVDAVRELTR
jgi:hypothetical protein